MKPIVVVATVTLKEPIDKRVREALEALHHATHQEDEGCVQYDLHTDPSNPNVYVFVETWQSEALLDAHMKKAHFKAFQEALTGKVESMSIQKLEKIL